MRQKNGNKILLIAGAVIALLLLVSLTTYAFFAPQNGGTTSTNATVTSNTTDLLTFSINRDISFTVTQALFAENGENQSGDATATLTPNNKTGAATMNYYLYLNLQSNPTVYSEANTNHDPELMLQVFDGNNQLVTLTGLGTQKTIKGVTGYDITGVSGLKTLLDNHAISATNNTATIENWRVVITLINLDVNQNDNTGKTISAEIIMREDSLSFTGTIYRYNTNNTINGVNYLTGGEIEGTTYSGVGDFETNSSVLVNKLNSKYCAISGDREAKECRFDDEQSCLDLISYSYYTQRNYTCELQSYSTNIYLKHEIDDNIISSSKVCVYYNNNTLCIKPSDFDTSAGMLPQIQSIVENGLNIQIDDSLDTDVDASVTFGDFSCSYEYDFNGVRCLNPYGECHVRDTEVKCY